MSQKLDETSILQGQVEQQSDVTAKIEEQLKAKETQVCSFNTTSSNSSIVLYSIFEAP